MFLGKDYVRYRERWLRAVHKTDNIEKAQFLPSLNLLCMIFPPAWFGYRKQLKLYTAFLATMAVLTLFEIFTGVLIPLPLFMMVFFIVSLFVSGYYLKYSLEFFHNLDNRAQEKSEREHLIKKHGGTSVAFSVAGSLVYLAIMLLVYQAGMMAATSIGLDISHLD